MVALVDAAADGRRAVVAMPPVAALASATARPIRFVPAGVAAAASASRPSTKPFRDVASASRPSTYPASVVILVSIDDNDVLPVSCLASVAGAAMILARTDARVA